MEKMLYFWAAFETTCRRFSLHIVRNWLSTWSVCVDTSESYHNLEIFWACAWEVTRWNPPHPLSVAGLWWASGSLRHPANEQWQPRWLLPCPVVHAAPWWTCWVFLLLQRHTNAVCSSSVCSLVLQRHVTTLRITMLWALLATLLKI